MKTVKVFVALAILALMVSAGKANAQSCGTCGPAFPWGYPPPQAIPFFPPLHATTPGPGYQVTPHDWFNDAWVTGAYGNYGGLYPNYRPGIPEQYKYTFGYGG